MRSFRYTFSSKSGIESCVFYHVPFNNFGTFRTFAECLSISYCHSLNKHSIEPLIASTLSASSQQHWKARMKNWPPNSPEAGNSMKRNHSPFCESTGPIVQEGFVAARIRALQALQAQVLAGNRSHSPMIACPPRHEYSYEPLNATRPGLVATLAANRPNIPESGKFDSAREEVTSNGHQEEARMAQAHDDHSTAASHSSSPRSDFCISKPDESKVPTLEGPHNVNPHMRAASGSENIELSKQHTVSFTSTKRNDIVAARPPSCDTTEPPGHDILGPRPISASLADSSTLSNCFSYNDLEESKHSLEYQHSQHQKIPRKSVADRLDSLVERGWMASDALDKARGGPEVSENTYKTVRSHDHQAGERDSSMGHEPQASPRPLHRLSSDLVSTAASQCHDLDDHGTSQSKQPNLGHSLQLDSPKESKSATKRRYGSLAFERSDSDLGSCMAVKSSSMGIGNRRASSMDQLHRIDRNKSESIELQGLNLNNVLTGEKDKRRSTSATVSSYKSTSPQSSREGSGSEYDPRRGLPLPASIESRSRRSTTTRVQSHRPSSRSTSWFKKSWFNPFSGDSQYVIKDVSQESVTSTPASSTKDGAQQNISLSSKPPSQDISGVHSVHGSDHKVRVDLESPTSTKSVWIEPGTQKVDGTQASEDVDPARGHREQRDAQRRRTLRGSSLTSLVPLVGPEGFVSPPQHNSAGYAEGSLARSQRSANPASVSVPVRRSSRQAPTSPSKAASLLSTTSSENSLSQRERSRETPRFVRSRPQKPLSSISVQVRGPGAHSPVPSTVSVRQGPRSRAGSPHQEPVDHTQRELKESGKGIKKIQVIITFDGADDLIVEAVTADREHGWSRV